MLLKAEKVSKSFGGLRALQEVSLEIAPGQIFGLIGPNGAGKTTLFNCLTGLFRPDSGRFFLGDRDITGYSDVQAAWAGISRTFQNIRLFREMTTLENVMVGCHIRSRAGLGGALIRDSRAMAEEGQIIKTSTELLEFVGLKSATNHLARELPYGHQRRLEIARALAAQPRLLCLDEPAAGMNPAEVSDLMGLILRIRDRGTTVLLIEHHMKVVMGICDRLAVLDGGQLIACGLPQQVRSDPGVIAAYLGRNA